MKPTKKSRHSASVPFSVVAKQDADALKACFAENSEMLLPLLELMQNTRTTIDELMHEAGRGLVEQLLVLSAIEVAGDKHPGKSRGEVRWHGSQRGQIAMDERKLAVKRPRLRNKGGVEVGIPAYEQLNQMNGLIERGLPTGRDYLFVIDGSKALRAAIETVFGKRAHVQRCRTHKMRNVTDRLPKEVASQVSAVLKAAYKLPEKEGLAKLKTQAAWLKTEYPDAAASLLEGLEETFTVNRLGLSPALMRCLCTTNIIENPNGAVRRVTRRVTRYRDADMAMRWTATGFLEAEKTFRKISGVDDLWILATALLRSTGKSVDQDLKSA
jgi:hypothetical protein